MEKTPEPKVKFNYDHAAKAAFSVPVRCIHRIPPSILSDLEQEGFFAQLASKYSKQQ